MQGTSSEPPAMGWTGRRLWMWRKAPLSKLLVSFYQKRSQWRSDDMRLTEGKGGRRGCRGKRNVQVETGPWLGAAGPRRMDQLMWRPHAGRLSMPSSSGGPGVPLKQETWRETKHLDVCSSGRLSLANLSAGEPTCVDESGGRTMQWLYRVQAVNHVEAVSSTSTETCRGLNRRFEEGYRHVMLSGVMKW